jgi:hypothetical protein
MSRDAGVAGFFIEKKRVIDKIVLVCYKTVSIAL